MAGESSAIAKGFGKYSSSTSGFRFGSGSVPQTKSFVFGRSFDGGDSSAATNVFGKASSGTWSGGSPNTMVFGSGGGSLTSLVGGNQPVSSTQAQGSSTFSFGRVASNTDVPGSLAPKSDAGGFSSVSGWTSNISGTSTLGPERNSFHPFERAAAIGSTGGTFAFDSNKSNVPTFGNTNKVVVPASGFTFNGGSGTSSYVWGKSAVRPCFDFGRGGKNPSGGGSITKPYQPTPVVDNAGKMSKEKLQSKSAMPEYESKSHEELRWEDYQCKRGGGSEQYQPTPVVDNTGTMTAEKLQSKSAMPDYESKSHEELRWEDYQCKRGYSAVQPDKKISSNTYQSLPTGNNMSRAMQPFSPVPEEKPTFTTHNDYTNKWSGIFRSHVFTTQPSTTRTEVTFKPIANSPNCSSPLTSNAWWVVPQPAIVSIPTTPIPMAPPADGQLQPSFPSFPEHSKPVQEPAVPLSKYPLQSSQGMALPTPLLDAVSTPPKPVFNEIVKDVQLPRVRDLQPAVVANPFGTHRETNPMSHIHSKSLSLVQQGISGMPVISKPTPAKTSSFLSCRHLSRNRIKLPARKPITINNNQKVPFFYPRDEFPHLTKGHSWIIARESPKAWVGNPTPLSSTTYTPCITSPVNSDVTSSSSLGDLYVREAKCDNTITANLGKLHVQDYPNNTMSQTSLEYETPQLPKLELSDYYTKPSMEDMASKEKADPGFLSRVKDFVVGRHGYGQIKFMGQTDVRQLDIASIITFGHREVIVYPDEKTKSPVGQGLNKPAEITLLNIKAMNKKTGRQFTDGEMADKYKKMLIQKTKDIGAEFISYDPVAGEWKFSVPHFSCN